MSLEVKTYSASEVIMTFGGTVVQGWESISVARVSPSFRMIQGIGGKNTRVSLGNTASVITIVLPQTSELNKIFSGIVALDEIYKTGRIEVTIKDVLGGEVFSSTEAFLEAPAERSYEAGITTRTWKMNCLSSNSTQNSSSAVGRLVDFVQSIF